MNGPAPQPWDVQVFASQKFKTETKKMEVPHTACVKASLVFCRGILSAVCIITDTLEHWRDLHRRCYYLYYYPL